MFVVMTHTNQPGSIAFFDSYDTKREAMTSIRGLENNGMFAILLFTGDAQYSTPTE